MAVDVNDVDKSRPIAGGVTTAKLPHIFKNSRRSSSSSVVGIRYSPGATALFNLNHIRAVTPGGAARWMGLAEKGLTPLRLHASIRAQRQNFLWGSLHHRARRNHTTNR